MENKYRGRYIENYPCCAFLCKRAFHNMTLAQKGAAGIIFDITYIQCPICKLTCFRNRNENPIGPTKLAPHDEEL